MGLHESRTPVDGVRHRDAELPIQGVVARPITGQYFADVPLDDHVLVAHAVVLDEGLHVHVLGV